MSVELAIKVLSISDPQGFKNNRHCIVSINEILKTFFLTIVEPVVNVSMLLGYFGEALSCIG